jgi:hypothetical protein|tara:strand:+ start:959 stop:1219 length:261 start_codon:yes stop_codon:yes gene_type:complete
MPSLGSLQGEGFYVVLPDRISFYVSLPCPERFSPFALSNMLENHDDFFNLSPTLGVYYSLDEPCCFSLGWFGLLVFIGRSADATTL